MAHPRRRSLVYYEGRKRYGSDIFLLSLANRETTELVATNANEWLGAILPNGRFIACVSDESGREEVYVQPSVVVTGRARAVPR